MSFNINMEGGTSIRLTTAGKYCDRDIVVTASGGGLELPELDNPGSAGHLLEGYELYDDEGNLIEGTMPAVARASTTITTTADDTNDKLTLTASNNQATGYVTGSNKTASKTITLTASGAVVTVSDGSKSISKSVATAIQATPSISVSTSGLITASATQSAGYVSSGTKSATKQLTTQVAQQIKPGTSNQTIASGTYLTGAQTVLGDTNLISENIKEGVTIFDVLGSFAGSGGSLPGGIRKLATGSFTPTSNQSTLQTIDHNLGVIPDIFVLWADTGDTDIPAGYNGYFLSALYFASKYTISDGTVFNCLNFSARATSTNVLAARGQGNAGSNNTMVVPVACSFKGGITHKWVACVFE